MAQTIKARPTTYKGIQMRSRLEAGFAQWLDYWHVEWTYEPQAFASAAGQYLPDFRVDHVVGLGVYDARMYVEVKPPPFFDDDAAFFDLLRRMAIIWESEPDAQLVIASPTERVHGEVSWRIVTPGDSRSPVCWSDIRVGIDYVANRLTLCEPIPVEYGPWFGEWWKGA